MLIVCLFLPVVNNNKCVIDQYSQTFVSAISCMRMTLWRPVMSQWLGLSCRYEYC